MHSALLLVAALQAGSTPAPSLEDSPVVKSAKANRASMKTAPTYTVEPDTVVPDDAKLHGEHGEVSLAGVVDTDGRFIETRIKSTSRSDRIDAAALRAAQEARFAPARDADGRPIAAYISVLFNFTNTPLLDREAFPAYRCGQFVRDQDWWKQAWPERSDRNLGDFGDLLTGMVMLSSGTRPEAFQRNAARSDAVWDATLKECRTKPDAAVVDVFLAVASLPKPDRWRTQR